MLLRVATTRIRSPVPANGLYFVMHEQVVGEVGVVAVEPEVVERRCRIRWSSDQTAQRDGVQPHVDRFGTDRSPHAHRHGYGCQGQQAVADR